MTYPTKAEVCGVLYNLNTDYKVALRCFSVINDPDVCDEERALAVIYLLFDHIPDKYLNEFLRVSKLFLQCGNENNDKNSGSIDVDYIADQAYISASFMSDYHMNIDAIPYMHWWKYVELINGLTDQCVLSRVREIRNYDLSECKDPKVKSKIIRAKQQFSLPVRHSKKQKSAIDEFETLFLEESK